MKRPTVSARIAQFRRELYGQQGDEELAPVRVISIMSRVGRMNDPKGSADEIELLTREARGRLTGTCMVVRFAIRQSMGHIFSRAKLSWQAWQTGRLRKGDDPA
jgi:hypothetical protein